MFTLRCTKALLNRIKRKPNPAPPLPTTILGDWYATIVFNRPKQLVLCVSERTLLPVLVEASNPTTLGPRLWQAVVELLQIIGIPRDAIRAEGSEMATLAVSTTASRTILGSMNDFASLLSFDRPSDSPIKRALKLADAPCRSIAMNSPRQATIELFRTSEFRIVK